MNIRRSDKSFSIEEAINFLSSEICDDNKILVHVFANNECFGGPTNLKGNTQEEVLIKAAKNDFDKFWKGKDDKNFYPIDEIIDNQFNNDTILRRPISYKKLRSFIIDNNKIDYIFLPAPRLPWTKNNGKEFMFKEDREVVKQKIRLLFRAAIIPPKVKNDNKSENYKQKYKYILSGLGWGCGAFACPADDMERVWNEVIDEINNERNDKKIDLNLWFCNKK